MSFLENLRDALFKYESKLFCFVKREKKIIAWVIIDKEKLLEILPDAFQLTVYASFLRLLSKHGFTRRKGTQVWEHATFASQYLSTCEPVSKGTKHDLGGDEIPKRPRKKMKPQITFLPYFKSPLYSLPDHEYYGRTIQDLHDFQHQIVIRIGQLEKTCELLCEKVKTLENNNPSWSNLSFPSL